MNNKLPDLTHASACYQYAYRVLKGPFPLGEAAIAEDGDYSYWYATETLKAPFPLGEPAIKEISELWGKYQERFPNREYLAVQDFDS